MFFFLRKLRPPEYTRTDTLFPYTTLFRSNPRNDFLDIDGVSGVAHESNVPLIVDNTVATPYFLRPIEWGADLVIHSATKFLGGHGNSMGGIIVDAGTLDFGASGRHPGFTEPDDSYHGLKYWEPLGPGAFILKARVPPLPHVR